MEVRSYGEQNVLIADTGKHIRDINDVYVPATKVSPEHFPYYTSIIYLASNFDISTINEHFIEELI